MLRNGEAEFHLNLQEGEGCFLEFKENANSDLAKEMSACANSFGVRLFLGICDDHPALIRAHDPGQAERPFQEILTQNNGQGRHQAAPAPQIRKLHPVLRRRPRLR